MPHLLFSLRGVPEDEAEEVRELLSENSIDFYETSAGNWGISMPALWLNDQTQLQQAQILLHQYQKQRALSQRALYEQLKKEGKAPTLLGNLKHNSIRLLIYLAAIALVLYASVKLIFEFGFTVP